MALRDSQRNMEMNHIEEIGISLASPARIREWSYGEVKKPETINYRTLKPERDGLFCERIFGPTKDWECFCGKYKKIRYRGIVCDRCGVEVTKAKVRRERMGHIQLAAPVSHIWYFRGIPSRMGLILDMSPRNLEKVLYFASYIVLDPGTTTLRYKQLLTDREYREAQREYGRQAFVAQMGAEAVKVLLEAINPAELAAELRDELQAATGQKRVRLVKRLEVVEAFNNSGNRPEWMILDVLPVLPPELRPMVQLDGGRFATSDLNDLYRRVINRNNRLSKLLDLGAPQIIVRNEKRMLQEAVDALIDNGRRGRPVTGASNRALKSLSDLLKGKQGRFRQNLLGKRVDYSGRSVIVVGPELKLHQCGLPKEMAVELFKPFVMRRLEQEGYVANIKMAKKLVERGSDIVWDILEEVIKDHPVLLNRAPTLHRLGIQAFEPVLIEGRAIKLHPLVCTAYNADFDGDQMAVHVPLSAEAQAESRYLMLSANNLLKPQDGKPVTVPTQDMILGTYYLTTEKPLPEGEEMRAFISIDEARIAYDRRSIGLQDPILVRREGVDGTGARLTQTVKTTLGRLILNEILPQNLGFVDRTKPGMALEPECNFQVGTRQLRQIIDRCITRNGIPYTASILDDLKDIGFHYSTVSGVSIGVFDMIVPDVKETHLREAERKVELINQMHHRGKTNEEGRKNATIKVWQDTTDAITEVLRRSLPADNPIQMMSQSGARGSLSQIKQLAGMRGNVNDTSGQTLEIPIKSNLREGMNVLEFFISSHGARKSLSDTALKTADSGYLTRRLVDVAQDVIIREHDCGSEEFTMMQPLADISSYGSRRIVKSLHDRIVGRTAARDVIHPETGLVLIKRGETINEAMANTVDDAGIERVPIRTVLNCRSRHGICATCYGMNLATGEPTVVGEAVGIMAAQSIGEPGTQLTMRTFHTGGIASSSDITQGLPRVEELFEARKPKGQAIMSELAGTVKFVEGARRKREIIVTNAENEAVAYPIPLGAQLLVGDGDSIEAGDLITDGSVNPHDIMKIRGPEGVQRYIISEVIKVYNNNGVDINDKHVEIIARQMLSKVRIDDAGETSLMTGTMCDLLTYEEANQAAEDEGRIPASGKRVLLGIAKASLASESFLSAASFQETTRVLTDAAVKGKVDPLLGLKENVIIGTLIPAGTGLRAYRNTTAVPVINENRDIFESARLPYGLSAEVEEALDAKQFEPTWSRAEPERVQLSQPAWIEDFGSGFL